MCCRAVVPPGATNLYIHPKDAVIVEALKLTVLAVAALPSELPPAKLKKVEEVYGAVGCIWILDGDLIIGGDRGLYQLTDTGFKLISEISNNAVR